MERFFFNQHLLPLARDKSTFLFHPHTARTGGRTFREKVLSQAYGAEHVYCRQHIPDVKPWKTLTDADLRDFNAYTDLTDFRPILLERPLVGVALLRDPLYRAVSMYWFIRRKKDHRHYAQAQQYELEQFYRVAPAENPVYFNNVQCRRICGTPDAARALAFLRTHYIAAGFTNQLTDFTIALGETFQWPAIKLETKAADDERYDAQITPSFRDLILSQNAQDRMMYDAVIAGRIPEVPTLAINVAGSLQARVTDFAMRARRKLRRMINGTPLAKPVVGTGEKRKVVPASANRTCNVCSVAQRGEPGTPLERVCPNCNATERQRSFPGLFNTVLENRLRKARRKDLLLLSPGAIERKLLETRFKNVTVSSLYNTYSGNFVKADVQDLEPFADQSFDFVQACNVLEYAPKIDGAIAAIARVLRPEGTLCLHIADRKLLPGTAPVEVLYRKNVRAGYYPEGMGVPNVRLGRETLVSLLAKNGLSSEPFEIADPLTGTICTWWFCVKR